MFKGTTLLNSYIGTASRKLAPFGLNIERVNVIVSKSDCNALRVCFIGLTCVYSSPSGAMQRCAQDNTLSKTVAPESGLWCTRNRAGRQKVTI